MKPEKCRRILNGIASLSIGIVFLSNIPVLNSIRTEIIACATFLMISDLFLDLFSYDVHIVKNY